MKSIYALLYLTLLLLTSNVLAEDIIFQTSDIREAVKKVRPLIKRKMEKKAITKQTLKEQARGIQLKASKSKMLTSTEEDTLRKYKFGIDPFRLDKNDVSCPDCPKIGKLTSDVNGILQKLSKKSDDPELKTKVGELEAMYYIFTDTNKPSRECRQNLGMTEYTKNYDVKDMNLTLLFDKKVSLEEIAALQLHKGKQRTYFYRGTYGQKNIWVRVVVNGSKADVSYFTLEKKAEKKKEQFSGYFSNFESSGKEDNFNLNIGLMYQLDKYNLPKRVRILDFNSKNNFDWGDTEVNVVLGTGQQKVEMGLSVDGAQHQLTVQSHNGKDLEARLSSKVDIIYSYKLRGELGVKGNVYKGNYQLLDPSGDSTYIIGTIDKKKRSNDLELGRNIHLDKRSLLSIKVRHNDTATNKNNSAWLYYNTTF